MFEHQLLTNKKLVIFDRDGTIIKLTKYPSGNDEFTLIHKTVTLIRVCNYKGIITAMATNQSGIARGLFTINDFELFQNRLSFELSKENAQINHVEYCPHLPPHLLRSTESPCQCRKPNPGMILSILKHTKTYRHEALFIGDTSVDEEAAKSAGVSFADITEI